MVLAGVVLSSDVCRTLSSLSPSCSEVILEQKMLGDAGTRAVATMLPRMHGLTKLSLKDNFITPAGVASLIPSLLNLSKLKLLDLRWNHLGDDGLAALSPAFNTSGSKLRLASLYLSYNGVGDGGVEALGGALASYPSIRELELSWNGFSPKGAMELAYLLQVKQTNLKSRNQNKTNCLFGSESLQTRHFVVFVKLGA